MKHYDDTVGIRTYATIDSNPKIELNRWCKLIKIPCPEYETKRIKRHWISRIRFVNGFEMLGLQERRKKDAEYSVAQLVFSVFNPGLRYKNSKV